MFCRLAVDMGLGSIVRLSWDLISMSTATDYLVSLPLQSLSPCCATLTLALPVLHAHPATTALYQCCSSLSVLARMVYFTRRSAVKQLR